MVVIIIFLAGAYSARADIAFSESSQFQANLRQTSSKSLTFRDSADFSIEAFVTARTCTDSDSFSFDWLANSQPISGPSRPPPSCPSGDLLEQYDSVNNRWITPFSFPSIGQSVIVLNHGWNSEPNSLLGLAEAISSRIPGIHIYTWHWGDGNDVVSDANPNGMSTEDDFAVLLDCLDPSMPAKMCLISVDALADELIKSMTNAALHGGRLGDSLLAHGIRTDLHKIHLIGSSFGGVVCAEAAKTLRAKSGAKVQQITTLDTPALYFPYAVDYINPESAERVEVLYYNSGNIACLIRGATGGPLKTNATNVLNLKLNSLLYPLERGILHFVISDWYEESIPASALNCEDDHYGFGWSVSLNPSGWHWNDWPLGNEHETVGKGCLTPLADLIAEDIMRAADKAVDKFNSAAPWTGKNAQLIIDKVKDWVSSVELHPGLNPQPQVEKFAFTKMDLLTDDSNDAYIYREINIPEGTDQVALDVRFSAAGEGDKLTLSVGDEILIVVDACAVGVSDTYQTYYAYVGNYAGQTATIQIALRPSVTGQSVALVDNLRFTTLTLVEDITGDKAVDYADLSILAQNWLIVGCNFRNNCDGADIDRNNKVDFTDFARLASYWLEFF